MAQEKPESGGQENTIVRGADGSLYLLSKDKLPIKLSEKDTEKLNQILKYAGEQLSQKIKEEIPVMGGGVNLLVPEIFS
jgi:hypothetical protein